MKTTILWKLRQRFGITAPRLAVRAQVPWYARWLGIALLVGLSAALAFWVFDAGLRFAGYDRHEADLWSQLMVDMNEDVNPYALG